MKGKIIALLVFSAGFLLPALAFSQIPLSPKHKAWLENEVVYIITDKEKDVFLKLETEHDRGRFIEEFWKQRDPTPGTPRNEFQEEHYRRIDFANKTFGRGIPYQGWRTDCGRIYIMFGMPIDVQRIRGGDVYPMEIWYYHGNPAYGQPSVFRLLFFQQGGGGEFKLYRPIFDGPKALVPYTFRTPQSETMNSSRGFPTTWDAMDRQAYSLLMESYGPDVAEATYSFVPGVRDMNILHSQILLADIESAPKKKVNDAYAYDFLEHKATVEVSYSVRFIGNRSAVSVLQDPSDIFFLSYVIVPDNLSMDSYENKYLSDLKTTLRLSDPGGKTVFQQEKYIPIELRKEELKAVEKSSFQLYDAIPIIPGTYTFNLLLENTVSKEFTTIEKKVSIPEGNPLWMSPLVLARKVTKESTSGGAYRAYKVGPLLIYPCLNNTFQAKDRLYLFSQIHGLDAELMNGGALRYSIIKNGLTVYSSRKNVRDYPAGRDFLEEFSMDKFSPGAYTIRVGLFDKAGREILSQRAEFILWDKAIPSTWVVAQANPPLDDPYYAYILGSEFLNKGDISSARTELGRAYEKKPDSVEYAVAFAKALLLYEEPGRAKDVLLPLGDKGIRNYDLYNSLGRAFQETDEPKEAIAYYQKALASDGNVVEVLNSLGECYLKIGDKEQALRAWKKSLEINPKQEHIKKLMDEIKK